ncbi:MAG: hypothetical protein NT068_04160 [Candidatus Nomurabacteria bacterium]|nr:hypothetical protein [Candidatus Nomurabacteria bacterium]
MSIKLVSEEIKRFLKSPDPEVICIMGKWGVGKTFAWKEYLKKESKLKNGISLKRYSYVSLFGVNTIEKVKTAIFESTVNVGQIDTGPSIKTVQDSIYSLEKNVRWLSKFFQYIPKIKDYLPELFLAVRGQIICIDDLERRGEGLSTKEVLGFISFLKNERNCKVVLLLNDEQLIKNDKNDDFKNQLEKVIDVEMHFEPTPIESAEIGIDKSTSFNKKFSETCISLGIVNIRVIRKIEALLKKLEKLLISHDERIFESAIVSVTLLGWAIYQPTIAPSLDFIKSFLRYGDLFDDKNKEGEKEKEWRLIINKINFSSFDEFDALLLKAIQDGYFDSDAIEKNSQEADKRYELEDRDNSVHDAWKKYHNSFDKNDSEVLDGLYKSFEKNVKSMSPMNADYIIVFFRKFNKNAEADKLIALYMSERNNEDQKFYDPGRSMFLNINDVNFKKFFVNKLATFKDTRQPEEIIINIARTNSWNHEDIETLAKISVSEYYNLFKKIKGDSLRIVVSQTLKFGTYNPSDENMQIISNNAEGALKIIAKESPMNLERVISYGINVEEK